MRLLRYALPTLLAAVAMSGCMPAAPSTGSQSPTPVFAQDFPDPFIMKVDATYYGYSTSGARGNVQVARSTDLTHWSWVGNGLTRVPAWATGPSVWAPTVIPRGAGYVMYYAANLRGTDMWCLSYATADTPTGPFVDTTASSFLCQTSHLGSVDPFAFVDTDGVAYLLWQSHGVPNFEPSGLWSARLTDDGKGVVNGTAAQILVTEQGWEGNVIENPAMLHTPQGYFLFYSANEWVGADYATGVARCTGPLGPCSRIYGTPFLGSRGDMLGPGGPAPITAPDGSPQLAVHAWTAPKVGYPSGGTRSLYLFPLRFTGSDPQIG